MRLIAVPLFLAWGLIGFAVETLPLPGDPPEPVSGLVTEPSGAPVPAARVELWAGPRLIGASRTDVDGRFEVAPRDAWASDWRLRVERLGYHPVDLPVPAALSPFEITLRPAPLPLLGFQVEGERDFCAAGEDRSARDVWEMASRRHAGGLDTVGIASYTQLRTDTLSGGAEGSGLSGLEGASPGQRASAPLLRLSWTRRVEREGYAFPVRRSDRARSYDSWSYPPLEADFAPHFMGETFGRLHTFHLEIEDPDGWILRFCGRRTDRPYLEGALEIGPDTLIRRAEWRFQTPDPDEAAGGWARFSPPVAGGTPPPLLPSESVTWRSLPDGEVIQRVQWYEGWVLAPGDSVPFLPERAAGASAEVNVSPQTAAPVPGPTARPGLRDSP